MADNAEEAGGRAKVRYTPDMIGSSGLQQYGGYVVEEFLPELKGQKGIKVYREMADNDPIVGAVLFAIGMLIRQATWNVQAVDESPEAQIAKEFVESILDDLTTPLPDIVDEITTMFPYGHAPLEIRWKQRFGPDNEDGNKRSKFDDGMVGIRSISLRAQTTIVRWVIDPEDDSIDGLWQQPLNGPQVFIPIEKLLLFRTSVQRNNPEGRSLLRNAYRPWFFKKRIEEIEGVGVERDLAGLPVVAIPGEYLSPDADADMKATYAAWKLLVTRIRRDQQEGIVIPSDRDKDGNPLFELKLLTTGGTRSFDTTKILDAKKRDIATSVLADFIFLGQQAVGSFALSSDKTALFSTAVGGFLGGIASVFNMHLLPRLWSLNVFDPAVMPKMMPGDLEVPNLAEMAAFIGSLSGAGVPLFPDRELENHLRKMAGFPEAPEEGLELPPEDGTI